MFVGCRFLGNQDTIYTGSEGSRLLFTNCYIEGTTDFIFGPSTALFEYCELLANVIRISLPLRLLKMKNSVMSLKTAN